MSRTAAALRPAGDPWPAGRPRAGAAPAPASAPRVIDWAALGARFAAAGDEYRRREAFAARPPHRDYSRDHSRDHPYYRDSNPDSTRDTGSRAGAPVDLAGEYRGGRRVRSDRSTDDADGEERDFSDDRGPGDAGDGLGPAEAPDLADFFDL